MGRTLDAADPPAKAVSLHGIPVIQGIAPKLAVGAEGIRGNTGHLGRHVAAVQLEALGVGPHISGIHSHIDGHVANDAYPLLMGIGAQSIPLLEE